MIEILVFIGIIAIIQIEAVMLDPEIIPAIRGKGQASLIVCGKLEIPMNLVNWRFVLIRAQFDGGCMLNNFNK